MDTGAGVTVSPSEEFPETMITKGPAAKAGVRYKAANGGTLDNLGEKKVNFVTQEGHRRSITFQVCQCTKPLLSASEVAKAGFRIVLDDGGSYMEHKSTHEKIHIFKEKGVYVLDQWILPEGAREKGFARQG